jgi:hypothetical protein
MGFCTTVFGPAYLDRVLRVDRPLVDPAKDAPLDQSVDGIDRFGDGKILALVEPSGHVIELELPEGWPGPAGTVELSHGLTAGPPGPRRVRGVGWGDDLGGMGAGYAAAFKGTLYSALGPEDDPMSLAIAGLLAGHGIDHRPIRVPGRPADWTLLVTSGEYGDKLPVGFRGCHSALEETSFGSGLASDCGLRIVAGLPNRLAGPLLSAPGARCRLLAPALRNMRDREFLLSGFAGSADLLCCNRLEWETLEDREEVAWRVSVLVVTDGPAGASARFTRPNGDPGLVRVPAFPRARPPRDTNRAGEAFAAALVQTLLCRDWDPASAVVEEALMRAAMLRASAAAALVLDRADFGFPQHDEVDAAIRAGAIE